MGNDLSRARFLTLGSLLVNFGVQNYGMLTKPNMKDVADANHFAFSPNPMFIAAFFSGQTIIQAYWIWQLFKFNPNGYQPIQIAGNSANRDEAEKKANDAVQVAIEYSPIYAIGNLCIAGWLIFWLRESFTWSQVLVTVNTVLHLFAVAKLPPLQPDSPRLHYFTHFVAKTIAGIGILDFVDNGSAALQYRAPPSTVVQVLTYTFFPILAAASGPLFGSTLAYDLFAIYVGQRNVTNAGSWSTGVGLTALGTAAIVGLKGYLAYNRD